MASVAASPFLGPLLTNNSAVAIWLLFIDIVAECAYSLELLFDYFKADVNEIIAAKNPHTERWYAEKAKAFQLGQSLPADTDSYDNTGLSESAIAASKIIAYAAVVEQVSGIRVKVAKKSGSDLGPLTTPELTAFKAYMQRVKDAGVRLNITSSIADALLLALRIKYDPQVLYATGARIDGTSTSPVKDAIKAHLLALPFNGIFSIQKLVDSLQAVEGVLDLSVDAVQAKYGALAFTSVNIEVIPDSGYLRIADADLTINYYTDVA